MKTAEELLALALQLTTMGLDENYDMTKAITPPAFIRKGDNVLRISSEEASSSYWLDYYGEFRGGDAWINPILEQFAKDNGCFWEWENPSNIALYEA